MSDSDTTASSGSGRGGSGGNASNAVILSAVTEMKADLSSLRGEFSTFRNTLSDSYMPRREAEGLFRELRDITSDLRTHMTAVEEWRLSETRKAAADQITLIKDNATVQTTTQQQTADARMEQLDRVYDLMSKLLFLFLGSVVSGIAGLIIYVLTHH